MNAKRQTVWLVSMLSLMVVLSAYYLFTEDTSKLDVTTTNGLEGKEIKVDTNEAAMPQTDSGDKATAGTADKTAAGSGTNDQNAGQTAAQTTAQAGDQKTGQASGQKTGQASDQQAAQSGSQQTAKTDAQVLQQMQNQAKSGDDFFESAEMKRNEEFSKQIEQLMKIVTDSKENTDAASKAYADMEKIQQEQTKISNLEDELGKDYHHAIVTKEDNNKWKVTVQSNNLEKSQVVSIFDKAMSTLNIGQDQISVQYVP